MLIATPSHDQDNADRARYFRYLDDWRVCDFYKYNPIDDETKTMNYSEYAAKRDSGEIPAPNHDKVVHDLYNPIHARPDDL